MCAGLIPAHAGKTCFSNFTAPPPPAHPRSRGENMMCAIVGLPAAGSSPLTRGKLEAQHLEGYMQRLIPAHAGKTGTGCGACSRGRAHPRSRGENTGLLDTLTGLCGSSPLTRGKPRLGYAATYFGGLIPAHAGKTRPSTPSMRGRSAHPRSRGENVGRLRLRAVAYGSSPLTRGKPHLHCR